MVEHERRTLDLVDRRMHEILKARGIDDLDTAILMAKLRKSQTWRDRLIYGVSLAVLLSAIGAMFTGFAQMVKIWWEYIKTN